jgi:hypothetical protein
MTTTIQRLPFLLRNLAWLLALGALIALPGCGTILSGLAAYLVTSTDEVTEYDEQPAGTLVTAVEPTSGAAWGGTPVTIYGLGFENGCTVDFAAAPATNVVFVSPTMVTCTAPAHTAGAVAVNVLNPGGSSASGPYTYLAWWHADWAFRLPITVTNGAATDLTDLQVRVPLTYDADMNADFSDLRFTIDQAGTEEVVPFWTETVTASTDATFWVKLPALAASGSATLYAYFGNTEASSASDFDEVFTKTPGPSGLLAEWNFDEGTGDKTADSSGNANTADLLLFDAPYGWLLDDGDGWGTRTDVGFTDGSALLFDGLDDHADCGSGLIVTTAFTVEAWARSDAGAVSGVDGDMVSRYRVDPNDFHDETKWQAYDPATANVGTDPRGFIGAVGDGRYIYFVPHYNGSYHGEFLRYDTHAAYDAAASWTAFDPGTAGVGTYPDGYAGGSFDGRYIYFAPWYNGSYYSGEVLRYDTQGTFDAIASWSVFDPGEPLANPWSTGTALIANTRDLTMVEAGGKLYVMGGYDGSQVFNTVLEYDPAAPGWTPKAVMPATLHEHACAVWNGKIYVVGGSTTWAAASANNVATIHEYDPASDSWDSSRAVMPASRDSHAMTALNGKLYVVGGYDVTAARTDTVWEYEISTDTWLGRAPYPLQISEAGCVALNGLVYVVSGSTGGNTAEVHSFDPATNTWTRRSDISYARRHIHCTVCSGKIYGFGGYIGGASTIVEEYDPDTDSWTEKTPMTQKRFDHATALLGGDIFVAGGFDSPSYLTSVEVYDPTQESPLGDAEGYFGSTFDGRYVYFVPRHNTPSQNGVVLRYDTTKTFADYASWEIFDPEHHGVGNLLRGFCSAVFDGTHIYFVPYNNSIAYNSAVMRYDVRKPFGEADSWESFEPSAHGLGTAANGFLGGTTDGRYIYFAPHYGGSTYSGEIMRYDTRAPFGDVASWQIFDAPASGVGNEGSGFYGAGFDGRFVYFIPAWNTTGPHGEFFRYDVTKPFEQASSWSAFDVGIGIGVENAGYTSAYFDGRYLYAVPYQNLGIPHGEVMRFDAAGSDAAFRFSWSRAPRGGGFGGGILGLSAMVNTDAGFFQTSTGSVPNDGDWHHLTLTYDGAALSIFVDGTQGATTAANGTVNASTANLILGSFQEGLAHFAGSLDAVRLYDRALSTEEIQASAQRRKYVSPEPTVSTGARESR